MKKVAPVVDEKGRLKNLKTVSVDGLPMFNYYAIDAEGNRLGLSGCQLCGAAIILDNDHAVRIHKAWHARQNGA